MYEYIQGKITELTPSFAIIEASSIGYFVNISLQTYTELNGKTEAKLFLHQVLREDVNLFFGFITKREREIFRLLISVSGVGANTARMILSSLNTVELEQAVLSENIAAIKSVKGIGLKTAQRLIVDLKDKIAKSGIEVNISGVANSAKKEEALSALVMLGFQKAAAEKELNKIIKNSPDLSVEELIKKTLKNI